MLPQIWKDANITHIHKKGPKNENYSPISLTSIPCKLLEELIQDQVIFHLKVNNLISSGQHGFTERRSCLTNHLMTLEMITIDEDCPVDADFSEAYFDTVPHYRLLNKLKSMAGVWIFLGCYLLGGTVLKKIIIIFLVSFFLNQYNYNFVGLYFQ